MPSNIFPYRRTPPEGKDSQMGEEQSPPCTGRGRHRRVPQSGDARRRVLVVALGLAAAGAVVAVPAAAAGDVPVEVMSSLAANFTW